MLVYSCMVIPRVVASTDVPMMETGAAALGTAAACAHLSLQCGAFKWPAPFPGGLGEEPHEDQTCVAEQAWMRKLFWKPAVNHHAEKYSCCRPDV